MKRILCVVGTRPEAIKMAPLIKALQSDLFFDVKVLASGQHKELLQEVLDLFHIQPEIYFDVMKTNQQLADLTSRLLVKIKNIITPKRFDFVVAQGDTTTILATALAAFYAKTPFGHVEAGLRTNNLFEPFPEEMNRVLTSHLTALHFAPTEGDKRNLLKENIDESTVFVTGNTVIDALSYTIGLKNLPKLPFNLNQRKLILATIHRRESFGAPLLEICKALRHLAETNQNLFIYYPVHPNPNVHETVFKELKGIPNIAKAA
jgi:UDP-N-acetylglucosamine 2-epimerase (non-hydrolysing)